MRREVGVEGGVEAKRFWMIGVGHFKAEVGGVGQAANEEGKMVK